MISIVVPCYNEADTIVDFYNNTLLNLEKCSTGGYEFLFVDDGSVDDTAEIVKQISREDECVYYICLSRNFGKESAMYAGMKYARGEYVVVMDADLQDPPELLPQMYEKLRSGEYDCIATRRINRKGESGVRSFFARAFYYIINKMSDIQIHEGARDFRMMNRKMVDAVLSLKEYNRFSKGIFEWVGFKTNWIEYENIERFSGESKWSMRGLFSYGLGGIVSFSLVPLHIASFLGILMTFLSVIFIVVIIIKKLFFVQPVDGWSSMACIILFIGGIQLLCMGFIGEYLAKMYMETKQRPLYVIGETNIE